MVITKKIITSREEKQALDFWDEYYKALQNTDIVDATETPEEQEQRIKDLEADPIKWMLHYFEKYCTHAFTPFHLRLIRRAIENPEIYLVNAWSRELSKTGVTFLVMMYLHLTGRKKFTLMISATKDAAVRLLRPYKLAFEKNPRLRNDYGDQVNYGHWSEDEFVTRSGSMFLAVGAGQAPRGARNEELRPDSVIMDDFDTDEDCRNPDLIDKKWNWFEQAVYGTRSISNPMLVIFNGNIIADVCCIKKAIEIADYYEIVNIRDKKGKSTWPDKNTEEMIDRILSKISQASAQKEYFNNPIVLGKVFEKLNYGKIQPLHKYKFLIAYTDPSYKKNADYKATALIGKWKDEYHVIWVGCDQTSTAKMLDWQFEILDLVADRTAVYFWIEWPWIDDMLKQEIKAANKRHNRTLSLKPDDRKKPDKFYRIESNLEPLNRSGKLVFNEELKGKPYMKNMEFQFLALSPKSRANDDGPDAVEGGVWRVNHKSKESSGSIQIYAYRPNQKRY
ncbi:hypothetical protein CMT44_04160 [Elizabethkingia anophelis]|uniref:hypothetical protein n=1 Tax=Elizabethkingia anophelis TaxID=1117645 RepID=UPI0021A2C1F7|nr:hypothetical protein [Elizabethkingia anophelis]MCT3680846.1 hypothetical protein [Elizabethkingia anophelis]MDV4078144.1 hypothetical protein [Elizabethkingia anophelis]